MSSFHLGSDHVRDVRIGMTQAAAVYIGTERIWPPMEPELAQYSSAGSFNYTIPTGCDTIDIVLLGGGEAGTGITWANGSGGQAGNWFTTTITRGVDIAWGVTTISGTVGAGGTGNGGDGGTTSVTYSGGGTYTATGGSGNMGPTNPAGEAAGTQDYKGRSYVGGGSQGSLGNVGLAPGGGGAGGGFGASVGGAGAAGSVWFYAYSTAPAPLPPTLPTGPEVAYDATGTGGVGTGSANSRTATGTHTCNGSAVIVAIEVIVIAGTITSGTVTFGGQSMTQLGTVSANSYTYVYLFGLLNPPTGTQTVTATVTGSGLYGMSMVSTSYSGVYSFGNVSSTTGSSATAAQTASSSDGNMVAQVIGMFGSPTISSYNHAQRKLVSDGTYSTVFLGDAPGAASVNFSATLSASSAWASMTVQLKG